MACTRMQDYARALDDCNRLLELEPRHALAYALRSLLHYQHQHVQDSLMDYSRALQIDASCLLAGLSPGVAERTRRQSLHQLADHIDGLRSNDKMHDAPAPLVHREAQSLCGGS